jgi:cell division protease FtsH
MSNQKPQNPQQPFQLNWRVLVWVALLWLFLGYWFQSQVPSDVARIPYSAFLQYVGESQVKEITVQGDQIKGEFSKPVKIAPNGKGDGGSKQEYERFHTVMPPFGGSDLMALLTEKGVTVRAKSESQPWYVTLLVGLLPWVLIIGVFVYMSRKARERMNLFGGGGMFGFGKSKAKLYEKSSSDVTFEDVAGLANAKKELTEIVDFLKQPGKYRSLGGQLPKGVLLVGPPGTGKTLMARAVAGEAGVPFFSISASEFIEMFVGVGASRVRDMFQNAKKDAPSIIFIDELDSIGRVRGTGLGGGHDEREQTLNQILSEMDGFEPEHSVVVIAATNRPDVLDPALIRPGRFDRRVTLDLPQRKARREILEIHTRKVPLAADVDLDLVAGRTVGFSGADLRNLVNEASLLAARKGRERVGAEQFDQGIDKIRLGTEREDMLLDEEKELVAYHESGHTLVARHLPGADPVEKVTIMPRGSALGVTEQIPEEDRHNFRRSYLIDRIAVMLGGRAAEKLVFDDVTSGAANDLKQATQLARRMVCQWGMSERLGPVTYRQGEQHPFLGRELSEPKDFSEHTAQLIDEEVQGIVEEMMGRAEQLLEEHRQELEALAKALVQRETLLASEIDEVLQGGRKGEGGVI